MGGKTICVLVGPEKKAYNIHEAILTHHSEYFRNALRGPWKEADEGIIPLGGVEIETCK